MATRSYSLQAFVVEPPALEMSWISEGGRLRSRWTIAAREKSCKLSSLNRTPALQVITQRVAAIRPEGLYLLGGIKTNFTAEAQSR